MASNGGSGNLHRYTVTPEQAADWLKRKRPGNEYRIRPNTVSRYAKAMRAGNWPYTGEPIIFGDDGLINNGHNRLAACVQSGIALVTDVVFNVPKESFAYYDIGLRRTPSHMAGIEGIPHPSVSSQAYKWLWRLENALLTNEGFHFALPAEAIPNMYARHPTLPESVNLVPRGATLFLTKGVATFLHYYLSTVDPEATEVFFEALAAGSDLCDGDPILALRAALIGRPRPKKRDDRDNLSDIALVIKAWNYWRDGKEVASIRWRPAREVFPTPY